MVGSEFPEMEIQMSLIIGKERCLTLFKSETAISKYTDYNIHDLDSLKLTK